MSEFVINIPKKMEKEFKEFPELENSVREFIKLKIFELELKRSRELQKFVFEALASKSRLTGKDASDLVKKIDAGLLEELKENKLS